MVAGSTIMKVLYFCICIRTSKGPLFEMFLFLVIKCGYSRVSKCGQRVVSRLSTGSLWPHLLSAA